MYTEPISQQNYEFERAKETFEKLVEDAKAEVGPEGEVPSPEEYQTYFKMTWERDVKIQLQGESLGLVTSFQASKVLVIYRYDWIDERWYAL